VAAAAATLAVARQPNHQVMVSWPGTNFFVVQTNSSLAPGNWRNYGGVSMSSHGTNAVAFGLSSTNEFFRLLAAGSQPWVDPTNIPHLAYYWNYQDLIAGLGFTDFGGSLPPWTDRVGGKIANTDTSGATPATVEPVGVYVCSGVVTNQTILISSNFSCCVVVRPDFVGGSPNSGVVFGDDSGLGLYFDQSGDLSADWGTGPTVSSVNLAGTPTNATWVVCLAFTNGASMLYTNGVLVSSGGNLGQPTNNFPFDQFGSFFPPASGYVQDLIVWTNYALTAADAAHLNNWYWNSGVTNVSSGLIAWWRLDNGSGQMAEDAAGLHPGVLTNSPAWIPGQIGDALSFNGTDQFVDITNSQSFVDNLTNFSISCWVNTTDSLAGDDYVLVGKVGPGGIATGIGWFLGAEYGGIIAQLQSSNTFYGPDANVAGYNLNDGTWHNIVVTFLDSASGAVNMCVDGVPVSIYQNGGFTPGSSFSNNSNIRIGADYDGPGAGNGFFPGEIDDVRIYNRVLSIPEILDIYKWRGQP